MRSYRFLVDGQAAILADCPVCGVQTPHKVGEAGRTCGVCGRVSER